MAVVIVSTVLILTIVASRKARMRRVLTRSQNREVRASRICECLEPLLNALAILNEKLKSMDSKVVNGVFLGFHLQNSRPLCGVWGPAEGRGSGVKFKIIENASITAWFEHIKIHDINDLKPGNRFVVQEIPRLVPTSGREIVKQGVVVVGQGSSSEPRARSSSCDSVSSGYSVGALSESSIESQPDPAELYQDLQKNTDSGSSPVIR